MTDLSDNKQVLPLACNEMGEAFTAIGEYEKAVPDFNLAVANSDKAPLMVRALYNRAVAYEKLGNFVQASQDYDETLRLNPKDPLSNSRERPWPLICV